MFAFGVRVAGDSVPLLGGATTARCFAVARDAGLLPGALW
jgi:hypothetical protein